VSLDAPVRRHKVACVVCPHCRQNAPLVYRGVNAFCTACGAPRMPLASKSVNLAGQPSKVGGTLARVFGWIVLIAGTLLGAGVFATCHSILGPDEIAGYVIGVPISAFSLVIGWLLLRSGKQLAKSGEDTEKSTRNQAIFALANTRGGVLTPADVARAIGITPPEADAILTSLAKEHPDHVSIDVDDNGTIFYKFSAALWGAMNAHPATWVSPQEQQRVAVNTRVANEAGQPGARVEPRDPLEEEIEAHAPGAQRTVR
jgi:hypothetical protein